MGMAKFLLGLGFGLALGSTVVYVASLMDAHVNTR